MHPSDPNRPSIVSSIMQHARTFAMAAICILCATQAHAQGCVAAHGSGVGGPTGEVDAAHSWEMSVSYRWFQSDRHYVGTAYQAQRDAAGDQVINRSNFTDLNFNYTISSRYSVSVTI